MEQLSYIDEHAVAFDAPVDAIWAALLKILRRTMGSGVPLAYLLGCDPGEGTAEFFGRPGDTVPGFRVVDAEPGRRLALRGCHRFARYALTFIVESNRLRAVTHADFPGVLGQLYRAAVIGSGAHALVTRGLLQQIVRASSACASA